MAPLNQTKVVREGEFPLPNIIDDNYELKIEWSEWQECDRCDENGEQKRIGLLLYFYLLLDFYNLFAVFVVCTVFMNKIIVFCGY